jgi:uncharacterized membrane protein YtjA (UPF0391 family)
MLSWGVVTVVLAAAALGLVIWAGFHMDETGRLTSSCRLAGLYKAVSECDSLVAGILGFSGLAWAHFFQVSGKGTQA